MYRTKQQNKCIQFPKMFLTLFALNAIFMIASVSHAENVSWTNAAGGNWDTLGNWNTGSAPGATDDVFITLNGTYTVTLNGSKSVNSLTIGGATGVQTLLIQGRAAVGNATLTVANGFTNAGAITLQSIDSTWSSNLTVTSGTLTNTGTINVNAGSGGGRTISAEVNNQSTVNIQTATTLGRSGADHQNSGTFNITGGDLTLSQSGTTPSFTNTGTINVSSSRTFTISSGTFSNQSPGAISGGGNLSISSATFFGVGSITANVSNTGSQFHPGASAGSLNITGNYTQNSAGTLNVEIGGLTAGSQFDQLNITGSATLNGTLSISLINSFVPSVDDNFQIMTFGSRSGTFSSVTGSKQQFSVNYNSTDVTLTTISGVTISQSGGSTDVTEGGATDTYTVVLQSQPTANVTITATPNAQLNVSPTTLTFTSANWSVAQTITVTAVDDANVEGAHTGTITHSASSADSKYNGIAISSVTANITDNETVTITVSKTGDYSGAGGITPGSTNVPMMQLGVVTDAGTATISGVKASFTGTSTAQDSDISSFDVYHDANGDGAIDGGDSLLGSATFTSGTATVTGLSFNVTTSSKKLLLALDIASGANPSRTVGLMLTDSSYITTSVGTVSSANFPIANSGDSSLPVELSSFSATATTEGVAIRWRTETEIGNVGFSIYRSEEKDGNYTKIAFVSGARDSAMPKDYQFADKVEAGKTYFYFLESVDIAGEKSKSSIIKVVVPPVQPVQPALAIPKEFRLLQNFPNPFNPETWIPYQLATDATVTISIYNVKGQLVRQLSLGKQKAGYYVGKGHAAYWDGNEQYGKVVGSGLYFYALRAGSFQATRRMVIVK